MGSNRHKSLQSNNLWFGLIILAVGFFWLLNRMDFIFLPHWLFSWEFLLIGIGLLIGVRKKFAGIGWLIPIIIGTVFLLEDISPLQEEVRQYGFPILIIAIGILLTYRALISRSRYDESVKDKSSTKTTNIFGSSDSTTNVSSDDVLDISNLFGSTKKKIFSKNFRGGKITTFFGSTDLDLSQADIDGTVRIDILQNFGGFDLIVPANWEVKSEVSMIFGGIEDERKSVIASQNSKLLVLTGSCMFGGIEIKSYN